MGEDRQAIFILGSETLFCFHVSPDSSPILVASKRYRLVGEADDVFFRLEQLVTNCPVAEDRFAFGTWSPFCSTSYDTALAALGPAK